MKHWGKWPAGGDFDHRSTFCGGTDRKKEKKSKNPKKLQNAYLLVIARKSSKLSKK